MAEPLRHRQTKEAATDMFDLQPPRHISTLPRSTVLRCAKSDIGAGSESQSAVAPGPPKPPRQARGAAISLAPRPGITRMTVRRPRRRSAGDPRSGRPYEAYPVGAFRKGLSVAGYVEGQNVMVQKQATQGRELSTLAPLRALQARTPVPAWARRAVGEGVSSCPRAGCGRSTSRGSMSGM